VATGARSRMAASREGGVTPAGMIVSSSDPALTEIIAFAGYEFVVIDGEHAPLGPREWLTHIRAAQAGGITAMVRVPENRPLVIQQALEIGAQGVVVPHVDTGTDAQAAVSAVRLPPEGSRGRCSSTRAARFSRQGWDEHSAQVAEEFLVIPIIESGLAMENLDDILDVEGIDYVQFGPGDLSVDLGVSISSPEIEQHYRRALQVAASRGKFVIGVEFLPSLSGSEPGAVLHNADLVHVAAVMKELRQSLLPRFSNKNGG
jgi:4-hydroxy-2-oxoheptanedioate aldolase